MPNNTNWRNLQRSNIMFSENDFEYGICSYCGGDDVECLEDCTVHKCVDCGHIEGYDYSTLRDTVDSPGG